MKITHVFTNMNYVYTEALIKLFAYYIVGVEQEYFICDVEENVPDEIKKIASIEGKIKIAGTLNLKKQAIQMIECLEQSDYTIFHFLPNNIYFHSILMLKKFLYKKIVWRIWGADLYNWNKKGIKGLLLNKLRGNTRQKIQYIIAEPMDRPVFVKQFGENVEFLNGPDPKGYDVELLESTKIIKKNGSVNILLGHSAVKTLCHYEILDKLRPYKNENIKIILPLNYGEKKYAEEVYKYAISLFPIEKIHLIKDKLNIDEYMKCLWQCDIAIIHSDRQIAMGNITMMMYMQKKIFLKANSIMDNYYRKNQGLQIYDSGSVGKISFEDFINNDASLTNKEFAVREIDILHIASIWQKTFSVLKNKYFFKEDNYDTF